MNQLASKIQSILFVAGKPLSAKELAKILEVDVAKIQTALTELEEFHKDTGIVLLEAVGTYQLASNAKNSTDVKNFMNAELREKLTDATIETLAIIAYRQPISRAEIEAIRGVNCQYGLRHLLIRGLIQKIPNPNDSRQNLYETTIEFLQHMGIASIKELPDWNSLVEKIKLPESEESIEGSYTDPVQKNVTSDANVAEKEISEQTTNNDATEQKSLDGSSSSEA